MTSLRQKVKREVLLILAKTKRSKEFGQAKEIFINNYKRGDTTDSETDQKINKLHENQVIPKIMYRLIDLNNLVNKQKRRAIRAILRQH